MKRFETSLEQTGSKVHFVLPFDPDEAWGAKNRHHVHGTINGFAIRGVLTTDGDRHVLSLGPAWLRGSGLEAGERVAVELAPEGPQLDSLPEDIASALKSDPQARNFFESLATFYRKGYLRWMEGARQPEKRRARLNELMRLLKAGKKQP